MVKYILAAMLIFGCTASMAQSRSVAVEYQKIKRDAVVNEIPFNDKITAAAIADTLQKLGYKGKESKGFILYKSVLLPVLGKQSYDLYFSVDKKSKKDKETSVVTLMVSRDFDNFISESTSPEIMGNAKIYMDSLRNIVARYDLEQQISEQEELVNKNEKKLLGIIDDGEGYEKDKKKLEDKIGANKKAREKQQSDTDIQKQVLETLKGKRKA